MPKDRAAWASWNYLGSSADLSDGEGQAKPVFVTYWINKLQNLNTDKQVGRHGGGEWGVIEGSAGVGGEGADWAESGRVSLVCVLCVVCVCFVCVLTILCFWSVYSVCCVVCVDLRVAEPHHRAQARARPQGTLTARPVGLTNRAWSLLGWDHKAPCWR